MNKKGLFLFFILLALCSSCQKGSATYREQFFEAYQANHLTATSQSEIGRFSRDSKGSEIDQVYATPSTEAKAFLSALSACSFSTDIPSSMSFKLTSSEWEWTLGLAYHDAYIFGPKKEESKSPIDVFLGVEDSLVVFFPAGDGGFNDLSEKGEIYVISSSEMASLTAALNALLVRATLEWPTSSAVSTNSSAS